MKSILKYGEQIFTSISLLIYSGALLPLILSGGISQGDGSEIPSSYPLIQLVFVIIYFFTACLLIRHWKKIVNLLTREKFILILIGIALISVFWSELPIITVKRSIALVGTTLFGIYYGICYSIKEQIKLLGWTLGLTILLSFIFVVFFPEYGIMSGVHEGIWRGIYTHKNSLGSIMALSCIVFLLWAVNSRKHQFILWLGFSFSIILLLFSTSKSVLVSCAFVLSLFCIYWIRYRYYKAVLPTLMATILIGTNLFLQVSSDFFLPIALSNQLSKLEAVVTNESQVVNQPLSADDASSIDKTPSTNQPPSVSSESIKTMTGRTNLWQKVWKMINKRPWFGYGYGIFWHSENAPAAEIWRVNEWKAIHAHNGLLDLWLDLGILGVSLFTIGFLISFVKAITEILKMGNFDYLLPLSYLVFFLLVNLPESNLLKHNSIFWVLYVAFTFSIFMTYDKQKNELSK